MLHRAVLFASSTLASLALAFSAGAADVRPGAGASCQGKLIGEFHALGDGDAENSTAYELVVKGTGPGKTAYRVAYRGFPRGFTLYRPIGGTATRQDPESHPVGYGPKQRPLTPAQVQVVYDRQQAGGPTAGPTIAITDCRPARG